MEVSGTRIKIILCRWGILGSWKTELSLWTLVPLGMQWGAGRGSMLCLATQSYPTLCNPVDYSPPGSTVRGDSPGKKTRVGCHFLLQGIFPTQGSNPGLLHCRWILYHLGHQGSPRQRVSLQEKASEISMTGLISQRR